MRLTLAEVPIDVRRRVVVLLENLRDTVADPTGGTAALTGAVTPLFGLDGELVFYGFEIGFGPRLGGPATGFIIASAGGPDQLHWSFDREPPSATFRRTGTTYAGPRRKPVRDTLRDTTSTRVVA